MASALRLIRLGAAATSSHGNLLCCPSQLSRRGAFFWRKKETKEDSPSDRRKLREADGPTTAAHMQTLKNTRAAVAVQSYTPPDRLAERLRDLVARCTDTQIEDWQSISLQDRRMKFKLLSLCLQEFQHMVPSHSLASMTTVADVLHFYSTPVKDPAALESLSRERLPPNLHIQLEPVRFHPDTDTLFGGKTAFPDRPTVVTSIKYRHKYKGTEE